MKKTRLCYDREFKLSVVAELEGGKPPVKIATSMDSFESSISMER